VSNASNDDQKARASELLRKTLDKYFATDIQSRREELEDIKARVAEMEAHLAKRIAARERIVDLQLQTFLNEAEGLGFFTEPNSTAWQGRFGTIGSSYEGGGGLGGVGGRGGGY